MDLMHIRLDNSVTEADAILSKIAPGFKLKSRLSKTVVELGKTATDAARSKVPVDTHELRDEHIYQVDTLDMSTVAVDNETHIGDNYESADRPTGSELAQELDSNGLLHRQSNSAAIPPFSSEPQGSPTAGWIKEAQSAFAAQAKKRLSNGIL